MTTAAIIKEINKLPLTDQLLLLEKTLKTIRKLKKHKMDTAVHVLYDDYVSDRELIIFTKLDCESFYVAR